MSSAPSFRLLVEVPNIAENETLQQLAQFTAGKGSHEINSQRNIQAFKHQLDTRNSAVSSAGYVSQ